MAHPLNSIDHRHWIVHDGNEVLPDSNVNLPFCEAAAKPRPARPRRYSGTTATKRPAQPEASMYFEVAFAVLCFVGTDQPDEMKGKEGLDTPKLIMKGKDFLIHTLRPTKKVEGVIVPIATEGL